MNTADLTAGLTSISVMTTTREGLLISAAMPITERFRLNMKTE